MTSWSRSGNSDFESFKFRVKLSPIQWHTTNSDRDPGHDTGGEIHLIKDIFKAIKEHETFDGFTIERRATRTMFLPKIVVVDEVIPEDLTTPQAIAQLAQGPQYDIFISFATKGEAALFNLTFKGGGVSVGYDGIN